MLHRFAHLFPMVRRCSPGSHLFRSPCKNRYLGSTYRIGMYYSRLPVLTASDEPVTEFFVSAGVGLPFYRNAGRLDFALQVGQRGDLKNDPLQENIIRFVAALSGAQKWFVRRF